MKELFAMLSYSRLEKKKKKNHLVFIKEALNTVPPEKAASYCPFMLTLYPEMHSKAFKIP